MTPGVLTTGPPASPIDELLEKCQIFVVYLQFISVLFFTDRTLLKNLSAVEVTLSPS